MAAILNKKAFKDLDIKSGTINILLRLNKFVLKAFNQILYNWEVNELLVASFLLGFLNHHFSIVIVKTINIALLKTKFELILDSQDFNKLNGIMRINGRKIKPGLIYKHYIYCNLAFQKLSI